MKFGVNILNFGPGANPHKLRKWAQVAEGLGYCRAGHRSQERGVLNPVPPSIKKRTARGREETVGIPQGDLRLLDTAIAQRLLTSTIPARLAYIAGDGTPRVIPTWFHWNGSEVVMATFIAGPHVRHPPGRPAALRRNPTVAITIDTEGFPPQVLQIRGRAAVSEVDGLPRNLKWRRIATLERWAPRTMSLR